MNEKEISSVFTTDKVLREANLKHPVEWTDRLGFIIYGEDWIKWNPETQKIERTVIREPIRAIMMEDGDDDRNDDGEGIPRTWWNTGTGEESEAPERIEDG